MFGKKLWTVLLAGLLILGLMAVPASAAKYTMKFGHGGNTNDWTSLNEMGLFLKNYIESNSQGQIEVQIYPSFQLGNFRQMMEQVQRNTLEMCHTTAGGASSFWPVFNVVDMPYYIDDEVLSSMFMMHPFWKEISAEFLKKSGNVRWVAAAAQGFRNFLTTKPVKSAADLKGMKIRTIQSTLQQKLCETLGAASTPIPWPEVYTSLRSGVIDGMKHDVSVIINYKMDPLKYAIIDRHAPLTDFFWVSDKWLQSLPKDLQAIVIDGAREAGRVATGVFWALQLKHIKEFKKRGGTITMPTPEIREAFNATKAPMGKWFVEQYGEEGAMWLKKFEAAVDDCKKQMAASKNAFGMKD